MRLEMELSVPVDVVQPALTLATMAALLATELDCAGAVVHRLTIEEVDA